MAEASHQTCKNFWIVSLTLNAWAQKATQEGGKKHFQLNIKIKSSKRTNQQEHLELETRYTPGCIAKSPQVFATGKANRWSQSSCVCPTVSWKRQHDLKVPRCFCSMWLKSKTCWYLSLACHSRHSYSLKGLRICELLCFARSFCNHAIQREPHSI